MRNKVPVSVTLVPSSPSPSSPLSSPTALSRLSPSSPLPASSLMHRSSPDPSSKCIRDSKDGSHSDHPDRDGQDAFPESCHTSQSSPSSRSQRVQSFREGKSNFSSPSYCPSSCRQCDHVLCHESHSLPIHHEDGNVHPPVHQEDVTRHHGSVGRSVSDCEKRIKSTWSSISQPILLAESNAPLHDMGRKGSGLQPSPVPACCSTDGDALPCQPLAYSGTIPSSSCPHFSAILKCIPFFVGFAISCLHPPA